MLTSAGYSPPRNTISRWPSSSPGSTTSSTRRASCSPPTSSGVSLPEAVGEGEFQCSTRSRPHHDVIRYVDRLRRLFSHLPGRLRETILSLDPRAAHRDQRGPTS